MKLMTLLFLAFFTTSALACPPVRSRTQLNHFRAKHPCPTTLQAKGACPGYVIDHIVALCVGGPDTPANMQWQTIAEGRAKDRWECRKK